ncbi:MAG TPA: S41 family peptidase, partial [Niabella sp.]|nr:S41 family peptidase [Niabella sp.]
MKIRLVVLSLIFCNLASAQKKFSQKELVEDLAFFGNLLINNDPISTIEEKQASAASLEKALKSFDKTNLTTAEFIKYLRSLKSLTKYDMHAGISFTDTIPPTNLFPLPVISIDKKLFVNAENDLIPFGSNIRSINGISTSEILYQLTGGDTTNTFKLEKLANEFFYLYYLFLGNPEQFVIEYALNNTNESQTITVKGVSIFEYLETDARKIFPLHRDFVFTQYYPEISTYYLSLNSFLWPAVNDTKLTTNPFQHFFDSLFIDIKNKQVRNLIIDLKYNPGGDISTPSLLFSYFIDSSLAIKGTFKYPAFIPFQNLVAINNIPIADSLARATLNEYQQHSV